MPFGESKSNAQDLIGLLCDLHESECRIRRHGGGLDPAIHVFIAPGRGVNGSSRNDFSQKTLAPS
jgi:hypothetical protein